MYRLVYIFTTDVITIDVLNFFAKVFIAKPN